MSTENNMTTDAMDIPLSVDDIKQMDPAMVAGMYTKLRESRQDTRNEAGMLRVQLERAQDNNRAHGEHIADLAEQLKKTMTALALIKLSEVLGEDE